MNTECRIAFIRVQVACMEAEIAGMIAENTRIASYGGEPTYGYNDFAGLVDKYCLEENQVVAYLRGEG